tara:strand:+ start:838 stop:990 length:153 start_codon:yes stop_codon:yes gene_type:complete
MKITAKKVSNALSNAKDFLGGVTSVVAGAKGLYDTGKTLYQVASPLMGLL